MVEENFKNKVDTDTKRDFKFHLHKFIATFGFVGRIKYMPGTFGSLAAFPVWFLLVIIAMNINESLVLDFKQVYFSVQIFAIVAFFVTGVISGGYYAKRIGTQDPKDVVMDEVVGQLITINLCMIGNVSIFSTLDQNQMLDTTTIVLFFFVLPFVLFRLFDIFKPWPIGWMDKNIKGGLGIMLDDVLAAIFAVVSYYIIILLLIDFYWGKIIIT